MTFKFIQIGELLKQPHGDQIAELLCDAAKCLDAGNSESACWRVADAAQLLQRRLKGRGFTDLCGFDVETERGALLNGGVGDH